MYMYTYVYIYIYTYIYIYIYIYIEQFGPTVSQLTISSPLLKKDIPMLAMLPDDLRRELAEQAPLPVLSQGSPGCLVKGGFEVHGLFTRTCKHVFVH